MKIRTSTYTRVRDRIVVVASSAAAVMLVGMFLGWFRSGERMRNSFEMFRIPQQLGLEGFTTIRVIWFGLPVVAAGVIGFCVLERRGAAAVLLGFQSIVTTAVSAIVVVSELDSGLGPVLGLVAGIVGLIATPVLALTALPPSS